MRSKLLPLFMAVAVVVALAAESSLTALAYQGNTNTSAAKPKARKRKKPAARSMAMPTDPQACLNRLATLAARDPLPAYDGEPSRIINDGMLWASGKCAITDQAQRLKLSNVANRWRMNDAAGVRSGLQELGGTPSASDMGTAAPTRRSRRGRRTPASETPAASDTATPPSSSDTQAAPATSETSGATNSNMHRRTPRRRAPRRNANTANTNS